LLIDDYDFVNSIRIWISLTKLVMVPMINNWTLVIMAKIVAFEKKALWDPFVMYIQ